MPRKPLSRSKSTTRRKCKRKSNSGSAVRAAAGEPMESATGWGPGGTASVSTATLAPSPKAAKGLVAIEGHAIAACDADMRGGAAACLQLASRVAT